MDRSTTVRALLDAAGLSPSAAEVAELEDEYVLVRQMADLVHGVDATRYESPCLVFDPDPTFVDWAG